MVRKGIVLIVLIGLSRLLYSQASFSIISSLLDSAQKYQYFDFEATEQLVKQAEDVIQRQGAQKDVRDLIRCYNIRIQSCIAFSRLQLWSQYLNEVDRLLEQNKPALADAYTMLALQNELARAQYFMELSDYRKAQETFMHLLVEFKNLPETPEHCGSLMVICNYLASINFRIGEFEASINQDFASIPYHVCARHNVSGPSLYYVLVYRNIGRTYLAKKDYDQASKYLHLAEDYLNQIQRERPMQTARIALSLYEVQASFYTETGNTDKALASMRKTTPILSLPNIDNEFKGRIHLGLGNLYFTIGDVKEAKYNYDQAESYFLETPNDRAVYLSRVFFAKAELFEKMGNLEQALHYCQRSAEAVVLEFKPDADRNPSLERVISKKYLFSALQKKALLLETGYNTGHDIQTLKRAFRTFQLALALLDSTANEFSLDKDKIILREQSYSAYEAGIRMAYELYRKTGEELYFSHCFMLADKSKSVLLVENLRVVNSFAGVKPEWLENERALKSEMIRLEQSIYGAEVNKKDSKELNSLRDRYASVKHEYSRLINGFKKESPEYYRLRFDRTVVTPEVVQRQLLKPGEALIEFFMGDSSLMILGLTADKKYVKLKKFPRDFNSTVTRLQSGYFNPNENPGNFQLAVDRLRSGIMSVEGDLNPAQLDSLVHHIYDFLLKDCLDALGSGVHSIVVVPDGTLGYLPFEALNLLQRAAVRYAPSSSYLYELSKKKRQATKFFFAGFVAGEGHGKYVQLPGARKEVDAITELLKNDFRIFDPADKKSFLEHAAEFLVLHLAMHSVVNDQNPMMSEMVFSIGTDTMETEALLTAGELYNLNLNADLVVLSACETGIGQLHRGEGIISFSRAFSYAGASSAVISLWKVPDKATSMLMVYFYKHLKEGVAKDEALRLAKVNFIRDYPQMAHPFYWAGFILTGSNEPLDFPESKTGWWYVAGLLVMVMLFAAAIRTSRFRRTS